MFINQLRVNSSAQNKYHDSINQERNWGDREPNHRNFRPHPMEESDDSTTSPKPDFDFANNKPHVDVQARDSVIPNRSEITTIVSEQASKAPPPTYHAVRSEQLAERVLHKKNSKKFARLTQMKLRVQLPSRGIKKFNLVTKRIKAFPCHLCPVV